MEHIANSTELEIIRALARYQRHGQTARQLNLKLETVYAYASQLRRKWKARTRAEWLAVLRTHGHTIGKPPAEPSAPDGPTFAQLDAMRLRATLDTGLPYSRIAERLQIQEQTAQNLVCQGCKRAGIGYTPKSRKIETMRLWLEIHDRKAAEEKEKREAEKAARLAGQSAPESPLPPHLDDPAFH